MRRREDPARRGWLAVLALAALAMACGSTSSAVSGLRVTAGEVDPVPMLAAVASAAEASGALPLEPIGASVLAQGDQLGSFVELDAGLCMLAFARAGSSVRDVDLFVFSDDGDQLVSDESGSVEATTILCPPHPRRVYVAARVVAGQGMVALGVMPVPPAAAPATAQAVRARGLAGSTSGKLAGWPGLERRVGERRAALGSRWEDVRRVALPLSPRAYAAVSVPLEAGRCLDVLVTPGEDLLGIDANVLDDRGRVVARSKAPGRDRAFLLCGGGNETVTVMARSRQGTGLAAVIVARSLPGAAADLAGKTWIDTTTPVAGLAQAARRHGERLDALGLGPATRHGELDVAVGAPAALALVLPPGCSRLEVVGGAPLGHFEVELWTEDGRQLDRDRGGESATLFACGGGRVSVEVTATEAAGRVAVLSVHDAQPAAVAASHPLAATRLLRRLEEVRGDALPADLAAAETIELVAPSRAGRDFDAPAGACVEVFAALEGLAEGIELGLTAGKTVLRSRGRFSASDRVCGGAAVQPVHLDLAVDTGKATLLWLRL